MSSAASGLGNAAGAQLTQVARNAATWGDHLGANFAQGIRNRRGDVASAAQQLAGAAAQYLHHTTPDAGPLMHDDQWGYHLAENIADAMERGAGLVGDASLSLASAVTGSFRSEVTPYQPSYGTQFYTGNGQQITSEVKIYLGERDVTDYITRKVVDRINSNMRMNRIAVGGI
ncbi:MAG: hypothetical protein Q4B09_05015 [Lachnospiraceae bacterium]|nr:hypothetical protein [Lachnospiraceae bacterium]